MELQWFQKLNSKNAKNIIVFRIFYWWLSSGMIDLR